MIVWIGWIVRWALTAVFAWAIWRGSVGALVFVIVLQAIANDAAALLLHRHGQRLQEIDGRVSLIRRDVERHDGAIATQRELEVNQHHRLANLETLARGRALHEVRRR